MAASAFSDPARAPRVAAKPSTFDSHRLGRSRRPLARIVGFSAIFLLLWSGRSPRIATAQLAPADFVASELQTLATNDGTWSELQPAGISPAGRVDHSIVYDPLRFRVIVFGGEDAGSQLRNDVWALSLAGSGSWRPINASGTPPPARSQHGGIYDPVRDRMLVIGGQDGAAYDSGVWSLSLSGTPEWHVIHPAGTPPSSGFGQTVTYDPVRNRILVFAPGNGGDVPGGVWQLNLNGTPAWTALPASGQAPRAGVAYASVYDPVRDRMIVLGGDERGSGVFALSLGRAPAWAELRPAGSFIARAQTTSIYDPLRDRIISFGGQRSSPNFNNSTSALELAATPTWIPLEPSGPLPIGRAQHGAIFDPVRSRMIVFGGADGRGNRFNDVWALDWSSNRVGNPSFEDGLTGWNSYEKSKLKVVPGGLDSDYALQISGPRRVRDEFGVNDSPSWVKDAGPAGTTYHIVAYVRSATSRSPVRIRIREYKNRVRVGSRVYSATRKLTSEWKPLVLDYVTRASGTMLDFQILNVGEKKDDSFLVDRVSIDPVRIGSAAPALVLHPAPGENVAAGSDYRVEWTPPQSRVDSTVVSVSTNAGETWTIVGAVSGANTLLWRAPSRPTESAAIAVRAFARGVVVADGVTDLFSVQTPAARAELAPAGEANGMPIRVYLAPPRVSPSRSPVTLDFGLPKASRVRLQIFDASGRRVKTLMSGTAAAGHASVVWAGDDEAGNPARAGIYFVRLEADEIAQTQRIVMLR